MQKSTLFATTKTCIAHLSETSHWSCRLKQAPCSDQCQEEDKSFLHFLANAVQLWELGLNY